VYIGNTICCSCVILVLDGYLCGNGLGEDTSALGEIIKQRFPKDHYALEPGKWLVSAAGETAKSVTEKLGLVKGSLSLAIVINMTSGYYGLAPADVWEWIASKTASVPVHA